MNGDTMVFIALFVFFTIEVCFAGAWNRTYMTVGLPIFVRRVDRPAGLEGVSLDALANATRGAVAGPLLFRRMSGDEIAFRERILSDGFLEYVPMMRGLIRHRVGESTVVVLGLLNWWVLLLVATFIALLGRDALDVAPWIGGALAILYLIQFVRYSRVAKALS
jgi:hypothetical protein